MPWIAASALLILALSSPAAQPGPVPAPSSAGFPRFDRVVPLESAIKPSANVAIGDVNGDGHLDVVLAKGRHWPLMNRVFLGDGRGGFPVARELGGKPDRSYSALLADLDGDRDLDVVVSNDSPDPKLVHLNDGKGHFRPGSTYGRPEWPSRNASVADLNGDKLPDIIVANRASGGPGANYVCLNRGKGRFDADCAAFSSEPATTITPADFNRDGAVDLVVPYRDSGQSYVYLLDRQAGFPHFRRIPFGPADAVIRMAEAADLDADGRLDIVTADQRRGVVAYFGQEGDAFSAGVRISDDASQPSALAVSDLNLDGKIDVVVGNVEASAAIYFNDGSGRRFTPMRFGDGKGAVYGFAIADLDRDGRPDIAAARSDAPNVVYFATVGNEPFPAATP